MESIHFMEKNKMKNLDASTIKERVFELFLDANYNISEDIQAAIDS